MRCRVIAFLDTAYYDDVTSRRPDHRPGLAVVAVHRGQVVALCDVSLGGDDEATIETIAVHPEHRRSGLATAMTDVLLPRLAHARVNRLHAWTRDDATALSWYENAGFEETFRYLHVYASTPEEAARNAGDDRRLMPRGAFFHAGIEHEAELRRAYERVHVCRRLTRTLMRGPPEPSAATRQDDHGAATPPSQPREDSP